MRRLWQFVRRPGNLAVLIALGGAIGFLWEHLEHAPRPPAVAAVAPAPAGPVARAVNGDAIVNGAGGQVAKAEAGGTAVNAKDQAQVNIH